MRSITIIFLLLSSIVGFYLFQGIRSNQNSGKFQFETITEKNLGPDHSGTSREVAELNDQADLNKHATAPHELSSSEEAGEVSPATRLPSQDEQALKREMLNVNEMLSDRLKRNNFLESTRLKSLKAWSSYRSLPLDDLADGSLTGKFAGHLDEAKGSIEIEIRGGVTGDRFVGDVAIQMWDPKGQIVTNSSSKNSHLGNVFRIDDATGSIIVRMHEQSRYIFQFFRSETKDSLIGNVYENDPKRGFQFTGRFAAPRI